MKNIASFLNREAFQIRREIEKLYNALTHLKYEGRLSKSKNMKAVRESAAKLDLALREHCGLHEKVLFPYLAAHVPRREAALHFLKSEHRSIEEKKKRLKKILAKDKEDLNAGPLFDSGIFLILLLRHHFNFELANVRSLIRSELRPEEKSALTARFRTWLRQKSAAGK